MNPSDNPPSFAERPQVPLRVRFYPLWWWYFVGCVLVAQTFLATRLWGGWNALALLQLVAFQVIFLPRIALIAAGISLGLTLLTSRMVRWIARPMATRWLAPMSILPPASEIPLYLRTGERPLIQVPGRCRVQNIWEPGWLIVTDDRLLWLSGIWRTVRWEIDASDPEWLLEWHVRLGRTARWFGGYVVGMPPRLIAERDGDTENTTITEVLAIADPAGFVQALSSIGNSGIDRTATATNKDVEETITPFELPPVRRSGTTSVQGLQGAGSRRPVLPPPRDYSRKRVRRSRGEAREGGETVPRAGTLVGAVMLPPRREWG